MRRSSHSSLRLLIVGIQWPPQTFIQRMINALIAEGIEVWVATPQRPSDHRVAWIWAPSWHHNRWQRWLWGILLLIKGLLRRKQGPHPLRWPPKRPNDTLHIRSLFYFLPFWKRSFDVVYFPWIMSAPNYRYLFDQVPTTTSFRGSHINVAPFNPNRKNQVSNTRLALQQIKAVHSVCKALSEEGMRHLGVPPSKIRVIYTGIDTQLFTPPSNRSSANAFRIAWVGNLIWHKSIESALLSIRLLKERGIVPHLSVIGTGPELQRMHYTIADLGLDKEVSYLGKRSPAEVALLYQRSDAFLLSSHSEGIANALVEAMAVGLPVVTTNVGGMPEAVKDGVEGFVVPLLDADAMAKALYRLAVNPDLRKRMGQAARQRVLRQFNLSDQGRQFAQFFRDAAKV